MGFKVRVVGSLGILFLNPYLLLASDEYQLGEIQVVAPSIGYSSERVVQEVKVLSREDLEISGYKGYTGLDLRERGGFAIQEDLSLRGTTFEQNLVLLEGIRVSDLQTGHHLMNLPFGTKNLFSLEVLPGGASPIYGAGGFGGALNFILEPSKEGLEVSAGYGSYDLKEFFGKIGLPLGSKTFTITFDTKESPGFIKNRDFDIRSFNFYTKDSNLTLFYGLIEKDFGARNFYTTRFDTEREETRTHLFLIKKALNLKGWFLDPAFLYRKNYDTYAIKGISYINKHQSYLYRFNLPIVLEREEALYLLGLEAGYEDLKSSRLNSYLRRNISIYGLLSPKFSLKWQPLVQIRYDYYLKEKDILSLGGGLAYNWNPSLKFRGAINYSYRLPSVTELRYQAIGIKGNPDLSPEKALNWEGGLDIKKEDWTLSFTLFFRKGEKVIDWMYNPEDQKTYATNLDVKTYGMTLDGKKSFQKHFLFFSYTYLNLVGDNLQLARYHGNYLRHNLALGVSLFLPYETIFKPFLRYQKRLKQKGVYWLESELEKNWGKNLKLVVWAKNLLDEEYYDIKYYPLKKGVD